MNKFILRLSILFLGFMVVSSAIAQQQVAPETGMRSNDKIYVVMAVCLTILIGLILYVASVDRKIKKIEDQQS